MPVFRSLLLLLLAWLTMAIPAAAADNEKVGAVIESIFQDGELFADKPQLDLRLADLRDFYASRSFKPVWVRDNGPKAKGRALHAELKRSWVQGLSPVFYNTDEIGALLESKEPAELARLDLLMSLAFIDFGADIANGRIGPEIPGSENAMPRVDLEPAKYIEGAAEEGNFLAYASKYLTADDRYFRLIAKLAEYSRIESAGRWPKLEAGGSQIAQGDKDPRVPAIRRMLMLTGDIDLAAAGDGEVAEGALQAGIAAYQSRLGLPQTGIADAETLAQMAVPLSDRIAQMRLNLERRRWQNIELGENHIYVNLADGNVRLVLAGETAGFFDITNVAALSKVPTVALKAIGIDKSTGALLLQQNDHLDAIGGSGAKALQLEKGETFAGLVEKAGTLDIGPDGKFASPMTVYITYLTAWATSDGLVHFRKDVFGRDAVLGALLFAGR